MKIAKTSKIAAWSRRIEKIEQSYLDRTVFPLGALPLIMVGNITSCVPTNKQAMNVLPTATAFAKLHGHGFERVGGDGVFVVGRRHE